MTLVIGLLTVVGAFFAAQRGAKSSRQATDQREKAAAREEWFRRVQWANQLALTANDRVSAAGYAVLSVLADSPLAGDDDLKLLLALSRNELLDAAAHDDIDDRRRPTATSEVPVTPDMIEAAKLRVKLNAKLGLETSPVIETIAAAPPQDPTEH
ncbi:hypothetical protein [Nakamurella lactea]|uniref:hypothetical protein n=1 Tax=Nakamurella lactea TaxID=459515 RepID=UPI0004915494|nr:hypothetical protein [Nakamurella lactea]